MVEKLEQTNLIKVLDHGYVRLVDSMGNDLSVSRSARVSYNAEWRAGEDKGSDARLINYLWGHGHTSPFESVNFTFEVKLPMFVARQWHRHRTWKYNEVSARYTELPEEFYLPTPELIGIQSKGHNKQQRDIVELSEEQWHKNDGLVDDMESHMQCAFRLYKNLIEEGVPRELARIILPVSTYTHMFATVDLNNLFKFLSLRLHEHAQYEIRVYAEAMLELIKPIVPACVAAWGQKNKKV